MAGAPSQLDLFDYKPTLKKLSGHKLPESLAQGVRFAFIQKDTATLMGSPLFRQSETASRKLFSARFISVHLMPIRRGVGVVR